MLFPQQIFQQFQAYLADDLFIRIELPSKVGLHVHRHIVLFGPGFRGPLLVQFPEDQFYRALRHVLFFFEPKW